MDLQSDRSNPKATSSGELLQGMDALPRKPSTSTPLASGSHLTQVFTLQDGAHGQFRRVLREGSDTLPYRSFPGGGSTCVCLLRFGLLQSNLFCSPIRFTAPQIRYVTKYRHCDGYLVFKVTDDTTARKSFFSSPCTLLFFYNRRMQHCRSDSTFGAFRLFPWRLLI